MYWTWKFSFVIYCLDDDALFSDSWYICRIWHHSTAFQGRGTFFRRAGRKFLFLSDSHLSNIGYMHQKLVFLLANAREIFVKVTVCPLVNFKNHKRTCAMAVYWFISQFFVKKCIQCWRRRTSLDEFVNVGRSNEEVRSERNDRLLLLYYLCSFPWKFLSDI